MSASGFQSIAEIADEYAALQFVIRQTLLKMQTCTAVRVVKVNSDGEVAAAGTVDVQPLVKIVAADGQTIAHTTIHGVPYMRTQGGTNAIIMDPKVGDVGVVVFASRDLSGVKSDPTNPDGAPPPSARSYDWADAIYLGVILVGVPEQYVRFTDDGIEAVSPTKITMRAPAIELDGAVTATSTIDATGEVTGNGIPLSTHKHIGVTTGAGTSGTPVP
jgi:hypothetical protein